MVVRLSSAFFGACVLIQMSSSIPRQKRLRSMWEGSGGFFDDASFCDTRVVWVTPGRAARQLFGRRCRCLRTWVRVALMPYHIGASRILLAYRPDPSQILLGCSPVCQWPAGPHPGPVIRGSRSSPPLAPWVLVLILSPHPGKPTSPFPQSRLRPYRAPAASPTR